MSERVLNCTGRYYSYESLNDIKTYKYRIRLLFVISLKTIEVTQIDTFRGGVIYFITGEGKNVFRNKLREKYKKLTAPEILKRSMIDGKLTLNLGKGLYLLGNGVKVSNGFLPYKDAKIVMNDDNSYDLFGEIGQESIEWLHIDQRKYKYIYFVYCLLNYMKNVIAWEK